MDEIIIYVSIIIEKFVLSYSYCLLTSSLGPFLYRLALICYQVGPHFLFPKEFYAQLTYCIQINGPSSDLYKRQAHSSVLLPKIPGTFVFLRFSVQFFYSSICLYLVFSWYIDIEFINLAIHFRSVVGTEWSIVFFIKNIVKLDCFFYVYHIKSRTYIKGHLFIVK